MIQMGVYYSVQYGAYGEETGGWHGMAWRLGVQTV